METSSSNSIRKFKQKSRIKEPFYSGGLSLQEVKEKVLKIQRKIAMVYRNGNTDEAFNRAKSLLLNPDAHIVAVHRVVTNKGSRTPGIKEKPVTTVVQYNELISQLDYTVKNTKSYKAKPLKRIYVESPKGTGRIRPLSIPSYFDRCLQALYLIALEPIIEEWHDKYNYGFRPYKSPSWAIGNLSFLLSNNQPNVKFRYAIKVDIRKCFDRIDPEFIKAKTPIIPSNILNSWLNCGYVDLKLSKTVQPTGLGVPQGGIISPLLANIALNGIQENLKNYLKSIKHKGGASVVRFADDLVILCRQFDSIQINLSSLSKFLLIRGLEINTDKTKVYDLDYESFEFLGYEFGKHYKNNRKEKSISISIPKSKIRKFKSNLRAIFKPKPHTRKSLLNCIIKSNPIIRGWSKYYANAHNCLFVFNKLEYWLWHLYYYKLFKAYKSQYPKAGGMIINSKIRRNQDFFDPDSQWPRMVVNEKTYTLFKPTFNKYIPSQFTHKFSNPYVLEDREGIAKINLQMRSSWHRIILKKNDYICRVCYKNLFREHLKYELHHVIPLKYGGPDTPKNIIPLCPSCHKKITSAVARKDKTLCLMYINGNTLDIPPHILKTFK